MSRIVSVLMLLLVASAPPAWAELSISLRGSPASMARQHRIAQESDFSFLRSAEQVERFADDGHLVRVEGTENLTIASGVSFPYARPEMQIFLERLASQHRDACGERLVVTSLTRPRSQQPRNSHPLSVHPTGMAVDLRILDDARCVGWLETTLLSLEERGLLDATRERRPPHFHVALFTEAYREYVAPLLAADSARAAAEAEAEAAALRLAEQEVAAAAALATQHFAPVPQRSAREGGATEGYTVGAALLVLLGVAWKRLRTAR